MRRPDAAEPAAPSVARRCSASSLGGFFKLQAATKENVGGPGFGKAKSIIMVYLQGGPSHLDLPGIPRPTSPPTSAASSKPIPTKTPGLNFTEILPKLAQVTDKLTMIRSMSYTPVGLFNHTAAIYQMLTGYTADKVSPSGRSWNRRRRRTFRRSVRRSPG